MIRTSPLVNLTLALVMLMLSLVMLADLFLGVFSRAGQQEQHLRAELSQAVGHRVADLVNRVPAAQLGGALSELAAQSEEVVSIGVRRADGTRVADSGGHFEAWPVPAEADEAAPHRFTQTLMAGGQAWGRIELRLQHDARVWWVRAASEPLVQLAGFLLVTGSIAFGLYMRRALQHLDPASVIPDRVQAAFDAMAEGVAVLDARGRVLLVNHAFRRLHARAAALRTGESLSALPWLAPALPDDPAQHPWHRAMNGSALTTGDRLEVPQDGIEARPLVVNCAPIRDSGGKVRGCLATFEDVSALHRANDALRRAMDEVSAARDEVQRKNAELERLATRDPLTGCLNRRALHDAVARLAASGEASGPVSVLMLDIDHFKSINDTHGHAVGDRVIQEVARKLMDSARATDLVCRWGGEEFCVVLPGVDPRQLLETAERVRCRVELEGGAGVREVPGLRVTVSVGAAVSEALAGGLEHWVDRADECLYRAKRGGRNRVVVDEAATTATREPEADEKALS